MRLAAVGCIGALAALAGCGEFGPGADVPRGAYGLESVDGGALPFVMRDDAEVGRWVLLADTLFVLGGGKAKYHRVTEVTGSSFMADTVMDQRGETNYRLVDGRIEVGFFDCPINALALCTPFKTGELIDRGFRLQVGFVLFTAVGTYRRR